MSKINQTGGRAMTDNTQPDHIVDMHEMVVDNSLDVIFDKMGYTKNTDFRKEAIRLIAGWHNKQTEEVLDRLESQSRRADDCTDDTLVVKMIRVGAERDRLNPSNSTPFNELKESK